MAASGHRRLNRSSQPGSRSASIGIVDSIQDWNKLRSTVEKGFDWLNNSADLLMTCQQEFPDFCPNQLDQVEKHMLELASMHADVANFTKSLEDFRSELSSIDLESDVNLSDQFMAKVDEYRKENVIDPRTHPLVERFKQNVATFNDTSQDQLSTTIEMDEGEGLGMGHVEKSTMCPITRLVMVEPVKNKGCGHSYSKEAILSHIRNVQSKPNRRSNIVHCPVGGCPYNVVEEELEKDEEIAALLARAKRRARQQKQQQQHSHSILSV